MSLCLDTDRLAFGCELSEGQEVVRAKWGGREMLKVAEEESRLGGTSFPEWDYS